MKLPILSSFIVLILVVTHAIKRNNRISKKLEQSFWDRERKANFVRKKSLNNLDYIKIPLEALPMSIMNGTEPISKYIGTITQLSTEKIVDLSKFTNTDLKLMYGTANIDTLTLYDDRYTLLVRTLNLWGQELYQNNYIEEAKTVLQFSVSTGCDVKGSFETLKNIYLEQGNFQEIKNLLNQANKLESAMKPSIVRMLQEACQ